MWTRLLGIAMVPLTGMGLVAAPSLSERLAVVDATTATERDVLALNTVLELRFAVTAELVPVETVLRSQAFGITVDQASGFMGFDLVAQMAKTRSAVDAVLAEAPVAAIADTVRRTLGEMRSAVDAGTANLELDLVHRTYKGVTDSLTMESERMLDVIVSAASTTAGRAAGAQVVTQHLVDAYELVRAAISEVEALFRLTILGGDADPTVARVDLIGARTLYRLQLSQLAKSSSDGIRTAIERLEAGEGPATFDAAVDGQVAATKPLSVLQLASTFKASFTRADMLREVTRAATEDATALVHQRRSEARDRLGRDLTLLLVLAIATVGTALLIAWSITRRLRPLAARAQAVSEGDLRGAPADERGPREVTLVARALNQTVATLRHIDAQAATLARGDLDDEILSVPGAGNLGASIHATVQELSKAWREGEELQQRLAHQANHDLLTSLPNRKAALEALEHALARANRHGDAVWVLFCDLDGFKRANDTFGHHIGDRVLRTCAERLAASVRGGDVVARLGGDEFVIITDRLTSAREAAELARRLIDVIGEPIEFDGVSTRVGLSVGIGMSLDGHATALDLLRDADNAVHRAKKLGKGRYEVFDEQARDELALHNELEQALRVALDHDDLRLHYQLVTDTVTGVVQGLEALCRWERDGVPVSPADFIPVAEQSDLINDLGCWALRTATRQLAEWTAEGKFPEAYVAVNVSGRHLLSDGLVDDVRAALDESGLDPRRLVIEITETVIVSDLVTAVAHLEAVRALGVRVALDDFGTGYTSIGQLWRLPIDVLKIDGSFIRHLETAHDHVIVELMIEVAHTLGLGLVAEGVETAAQQDTLRELNCDAIQGFLIARPQPPDRVVTSV